MGAYDNLAILLVNVQEELFKTQVHLFGKGVAITSFKVKAKKYLKENCFEGVFIEENFPSKIIVGNCVGLLLTELMNLHCCKYFWTKDKELVPFLLAEAIYHEALPKNIDVVVFQGFAICLFGQELHKF